MSDLMRRDVTQDGGQIQMAVLVYLRGPLVEQVRVTSDSVG
jgi:hypothetical protein